MMAGLFAQHADASGLEHITRSSGFTPGGQQPTDNTVRLLAGRGIDVAGHRSVAITESSIHGEHLVFTAEKAHVISIAGSWPATFGHTFTLPELVARGEAVGPRANRPLSEWLAAVNSGRPAALDYLDAPIDEIDDPTGQSPATWTASFEQIDDLTRRLAALLGGHSVGGDER